MKPTVPKALVSTARSFREMTLEAPTVVRSDAGVTLRTRHS